jgi:1-aminocyclopropane-1-carboxylate deaminase
LLTFGGAYSNHISATAALGRILQIPTIGIIRGDELTPASNSTLQKAAHDGMQLVFVNREEYSWRYETEYKNQLREQFGNVLVIEEGGANFHGMMGCTEIVSEIPFEPDYYILPVGTGTTAAGILFANENSETIAVAALNDVEGITDEIQNLLEYAGLTEDEVADKMDTLTLTSEFTFGGYGKSSPELIRFINDFYTQTSIKLDQVYTGKMMYALCELIKSGKIQQGKTVIAIHTGGLQGIKSISDQLVFF